jgi:hypothetical protein
MTVLNRSTHRRLRNLRQVSSVWEGDRRPLAPGLMGDLESELEAQGDCILWVDGTEGVVRAMDVVSAKTGHEAIVRTLLRAMESPHSATLPARPQKIVVCDREVQFFLRGVLQDLDIAIDYVPALPLIDEIFRGLQEGASARPPELPPEFVEPLINVAHDLWHDAPWETLDEEKILAVELNYNDVDTLYISILGLLGMEYGVLMYRSLDSLRQFRQRVLAAETSPKQMEAAFLEQDCFFLTFEHQDFDRQDEDEDEDASEVAPTANRMRPTFGNLHPLEGMRPMLYEEEAIAVLVAMSALHRFLQKNLKHLEAEDFPKITGSYRIPDPKNAKKKVAVKVSTLPEVATELFELSADETLEDLESGAETNFSPQIPFLQTDLVPEDAFFSLGAMPWEIVELLRMTTTIHQAALEEFPTTTDGLPIVLIQTSRPKALVLIDRLKAGGGLQAICFNPGEDPFSNQRYDLGILQTHSGELHLFGEFEDDDPIHIQARKKWDQRCKKTKGYCGLVVAKGLMGASRGSPELKDMMALFEVRSLSASDLGLGSLELVPQFE